MLSIAPNGNPSESYGASPAIRDRTVPPDTGECASPWFQPDRSVLNLPTLEGWKAELTLVVGYIPRWFTCPQTVTHPGTNHLIATWPEAEPTTSLDRKSTIHHYNTKPHKAGLCSSRQMALGLHIFLLYSLENGLYETEKAASILLRLDGRNLSSDAILHCLGCIRCTLLHSVPSQNINHCHEIDFSPWTGYTNSQQFFNNAPTLIVIMMMIWWQ